MSSPVLPLLELDRVSRRRGGRPAVREVSLALMPGEVLGLLGANGAGKSTTLAMMAGVLAPDSGSVRVRGADPVETPAVLRDGLGWLAERAPLHGELGVAEHIERAARLHGLAGTRLAAACQAMLERLELGDLSARLVAHLSQGQRQRVGLACALVHAPRVVVLDEPCNGLDPMQIAAFRALVAERAATGCGIVISTHVLADVAASCTRIAIMHEGRLRHEAPMQGDTAALEARFLAIAASKDAAA